MVTITYGRLLLRLAFAPHQKRPRTTTKLCLRSPRKLLRAARCHATCLAPRQAGGQGRGGESFALDPSS